MEWEAGLERYFDFKETSEEQQYKLAKIKLTKLTAIWLEGIQKQRRRENREKINTWGKLKKHLRRKYVPSSYRRHLFVQWSTLKKESRTVADYIQEWEKLSVLCDVNEPEEMKVGKFIGGLREDLRKKLEVMQHLTLDTACDSALTYEKYSKRKTTCAQPFEPALPKLSTAGPGTGIHNRNPHTAASNKSNVPMKDVMCFKCHSHGHYRNECPNARAFTNIEWTEIHSRERGPRAMLVAKDGEEKVILPPIPADETEGSYILTNLGTLQRTKPEDTESSESEEENIKRIYSEEGSYHMLI